MSDEPHLTAGVDFKWKDISGYFMRVKSFIPFAGINDQGKVKGTKVLGAYGLVHALLPNPDVEPDQRLICLPIQHKSDFKSMALASVNSGVLHGGNELVLLYEYRRDFFGDPLACFHLAIYPTGTWADFFFAVTNYSPQDFKWPYPSDIYQPSKTNVFLQTDLTLNLFSR